MGVLRSASVVSGATLISRLLGMVRDIAFASLLGASAALDAFVVAWRVPNLFRRLLGEGALSSAFIPVFSGEREAGGRERAFLFFRHVFTLLALLLAAITVLGVAAALLLPAGLFGSGAEEEKARLTLSLLSILFPYVFFINLLALFMAVLNSLDHFFTPAIAPAVLNVFWIAGILLAPTITPAPEGQVKVVAGAILVGGVVQLLLQVPFLRSRGISLAPRLDLKSPAVRRMLVLMVPMVAGLAPVQFNLLVDTLIAEICIEGDGANSYLFFGNRLMQFPLALIGIAMAVVVFPVFSRHAKAGDREGLGRTLSMALRTTFFLAVPAAAGLLALSGPLTALIYEWGRFTPEATRETGRVLAMYALGVPVFCGLQILTRLYYSLEEVRTPVRVGALMVLVNLALNLILVWSMKAAGLALATSISAAVNLLILAVIARNTLGVRGLRTVFRSLAVVMLLSAVMAAAVYGLSYAVQGWLPSRGLGEKLAWVFPPVFLGILLYVGTALLFRFPEAQAFLRRRTR